MKPSAWVSDGLMKLRLSSKDARDLNIWLVNFIKSESAKIYWDGPKSDSVKNIHRATRILWSVLNPLSESETVCIEYLDFQDWTFLNESPGVPRSIVECLLQKSFLQDLTLHLNLDPDKSHAYACLTAQAIKDVTEA